MRAEVLLGSALPRCGLRHAPLHLLDRDADGGETVRERRVRVGRGRLCSQILVDPLRGLRQPARGREFRLQCSKCRPRRLRLAAASCVKLRPVRDVEVASGDVQARQRRARGGSAGRSHGGAVGLEFVRPCQREGVGVEVGRVPLEEAAEDEAAEVPLLLERPQQRPPRAPDTVDPGAEAPVALREVPELVRKNRVELLRPERLHERHAQYEVVVLAPEDPQARHLDDARIQVAVDEDRVHVRPVDGLARLRDQLVELRRLSRPQLDPARRLDLDPERAPDHEDQGTNRNQQLEQEAGFRDRGNDDDRGERQQHDDDEEEEAVPEERQRADPPPVAGRIGLRLRVEPANQGVPFLLRHGSRCYPRTRPKRTRRGQTPSCPKGTVGLARCACSSPAARSPTPAAWTPSCPRRCGCCC